MVDTYTLIGIVTAVVTVVGIVITVYWNAVLRKDKTVESRDALQQDVEQTARAKFKEEQILAKSLEQQRDKDALATKQDMKDHVDRLIHTFKQDVEMERIRLYAKMDTIDTKVANLQIKVMEHIIDERDERIRLRRSMDFFQTMQYGPEAKSMPAYITGEEESEEHKEEEEKGVFASRKDTTDKDTKDPE